MVCDNLKSVWRPTDEWQEGQTRRESLPLGVEGDSLGARALALKLRLRCQFLLTSNVLAGRRIC